VSHKKIALKKTIPFFEMPPILFFLFFFKNSTSFRYKKEKIPLNYGGLSIHEVLWERNRGY
jgi:hypothetical protein